MYVIQSAAVALSALSALAGLNVVSDSPAFWAAAACTIGIGSISSVGAQGSMLSVEKEWTATLCHGDSVSLAKLNSGNGWTGSAALAMHMNHCNPLVLL